MRHQHLYKSPSIEVYGHLWLLLPWLACFYLKLTWLKSIIFQIILLCLLPWLKVNKNLKMKDHNTTAFFIKKLNAVEIWCFFLFPTFVWRIWFIAYKTWLHWHLCRIKKEFNFLGGYGHENQGLNIVFS